MEQTVVKYDKIKDLLNTGDLILFHGTLRASEMIEFAEQSKWSHVGMVIKSQDIGINDSDKLLLWESNTLTNLNDEILKNVKTGPMFVDLYRRLLTDLEDKYDNVFEIRYLKMNDELKNNIQMLDKLRKFILDVHTDSYPKSELKMIEDFLEGRIFNKNTDNKNFFCSELIAATYMNMGILEEDHSPNSYMPKDFSNSNKLPLIDGVDLIDGPFIDVN